MSLAKLKDKGQLTLPVDVRRALDAKSGDIFDVQVVNDQVVLTRQTVTPAQANAGSKETSELKNRDLTDFVGIARGSFGSVEQIDAYIRAERDAWD